MNYIIDPQRGPHIRDYSDQSQDRVVIYSNSGWWAAKGCGYTTRDMAGVYTRDDAYKLAGHCGPEKGCCFYDVPADHVPTLQAEVERLRAAVKLLREALVEAADVIRRQGRDPGTYYPKNFDEKQVLSIAEHHGYGNLMALLASRWYEKVRGGAFSVGECVSTNASLARRLDAALTATAPKGEQG